MDLGTLDYKSSGMLYVGSSSHPRRTMEDIGAEGTGVIDVFDLHVSSWN